MYLISYRLIVGSSQHYAPSAADALALIRIIKQGGGKVTRIEDRQRQKLGIADLELLASRERSSDAYQLPRSVRSRPLPPLPV